MQERQTAQEMLKQVEGLLEKYQGHDDKNTARFVRELESRRDVLRRRVERETASTP